MRGLVALALVVPLLAACGGGGSGGPAQWIKAENLPPQAQPGARLFESASCTTCHTYAGSGSQSLQAPDLTNIGARNLGIRFQIDHLKCPACVNPGSPMPKYESLGETRLHQLAAFLEASKGTH
jgi:mono/diheme cytochrome c family protein